VPQVESEVDRFFNGFVLEAVTPAKARHSGKDLYVELRLSQDEAQHGGIFSVHIPIRKRCPSCRDKENKSQVCSLCSATGQVTEDRVIEVTTPPAVQHGQTARVAMEDVGLSHTDLIVLVLVG